MHKQDNEALIASAPPRENRYVYNGDRQTEVAGYALRPNRRPARRTMSTFNIIVGLFVICILIVLYINNIIVVNQRLADVSELQGKLQRQLDRNATLQAAVNKKSSLDRIGRIAVEELGMKYPQEQPVWFDLDDELKSRAEELRQEKKP
jgi:cell division protein FtsL